MRPSAQAVKRQSTVVDPQTEFPDDLLVDLARGGDTDALDTLLRRYTSYARSKARTYFLIGADREDIVQEGMIGLFKAIRDFDSDKTVSFRSFAELCITRQIITAIKTATRQKHTPLNSYVSLHRPVMSDDEGERQLADFLASAQIVDPVELVVAEDEVAQIRAFLAGILSDLEAEVLNMYLQGRSYQDIALSLRRQAKSIDNALQRIKRKLESFLEERERMAEAHASDQERVVHVSRFSPNAPGGVFADGAIADGDRTLQVTRDLRRRLVAEGRRRDKVSGNGQKTNGNGHKTNGNGHQKANGQHKANGHQKANGQHKAARQSQKANGHKSNGRAKMAQRTNGSAARTKSANGSRTAKPAATKQRASARPGDLRASLRYAVAAAARTGAKASRAVRVKTNGRTKSR